MFLVGFMTGFFVALWGGYKVAKRLEELEFQEERLQDYRPHGSTARHSTGNNAQEWAEDIPESWHNDEKLTFHK